nr:hypothetical protein [Escherichia coli]
WGPTLLTCGPWRPINLEIFESRLADLNIQSTVPEDLKSADIEITAEVEGKADNVRFDISLAGTQVASETVQVSSGEATASFTLEH